MSDSGRRYWDGLAPEYGRRIRISTEDFHYGPLLPGDGELGLLPSDVRGKVCLELGCGAGQNSIFLARRGAVAVALDHSTAMLEQGRGLAARAGAQVLFAAGDLDNPPISPATEFDLIHSSYALPFVQDPFRVIAESAKRLRPGGQLLFSTAHPAAAGEWVELDNAGLGVFLTDYYSPRVDQRQLDGAHAATCCRAVPLSTVFSWLRRAGLEVLQFLEPEPLPVTRMTEAEILREVPYDSPGWREHYPELARVPFVAIFLARRGLERPETLRNVAKGAGK